MKKIISAIDFSPISRHALEYAIKIANHTGVDIEMVWVDASRANGIVNYHRKEARAEAVTLFEQYILEYSQKLDGKLSYKMKSGKVFVEICAEARAVNAGLIITGTHGVSGFEEYWIGSNAFRIVSAAPCPVITVRPDWSLNRGVGKIVVPIDSSKDTVFKVGYTEALAKRFEAEIHILGVISPRSKTMEMLVRRHVQQAQKKLDKATVPVHTEMVWDDNITRATLAYAEQIDAGMIVIMTEQESGGNNILLGAYAQQLVNNSLTPVMSIQPKGISDIFVG